MPQAVGAAAAAWVGSAVGALSTSTAIANALATAAYYTAAAATSIAIGAGINAALAQNLERQDEGGALQIKADANAPAEMVIGKRAVAGSVVAWNLSGDQNRTLHMVIALSDMRSTRLTRVWANGRELAAVNLTHGQTATLTEFNSPTARAWVTFYDGRFDQTAHSELISVSGGKWTSDHRGRGRAYVVAKVQWDSDTMLSPPSWLFEMEGAKLYDRRLDTTAGGSGSHRIDDETTWEYSENPAVFWDHYRQGIRRDGKLWWGLRQSADADPYARFAAAANVCDENVNLKAGGTQKRYRINGVIGGFETHAEIARDVAIAMGGRVVDVGGRIRILPGVAQSSVMTLDESDAIEGEEFSYSPKRGADELVNRVEPTYSDPGDNYNPTAGPAVESATYLAADGGVEHTATPQYRFETDGERVQRLASIHLEDGRLQAQLRAVFPLKAIRLEPGDWFTLTSSRLGFSGGKVFQVLASTLNPDLTVSVAAVETDASVTAWDENDAADISKPPAPSYEIEVLPAPVITAEPKTLAGFQASIPTINISWTEPTDERITQMLIEATSSLGGEVTTNLCDPSAETIILDAGIMDSTEYSVRARFFGGIQRSAWSNTEVLTTGDKYVVLDVNHPSMDFIDDYVNIRGPLKGHANDGVDVAPIANPVTTRTPWDIRGQTVLDSGREFLVTLGLVVDQGAGAAEGEPRHKVALYSGLQALSGGGDVWGLNTAVTLESGHSLTGHGHELDFNNNSGTHRDIFGTTSAWGMGISGAGAYRATGALYVSGPGTHPIWNYGVLLLNGSVNSIGFLDQTNAAIGLAIQGTKGLYAIDTALCVPATGTGVRLRNNTYLSALNAAGSADIWIAKVGADDNIYVRDIIAKSTGGVDVAGDLAVARDAAPAVFTLSASTLQDRILRWATAGVRRWDMIAAAWPESGSNAGSDLLLRAYDDAGNSLGDLVVFGRATLASDFYGAVNVPAGFYVRRQSGPEGGEIRLQAPETGTTLAGDVNIDVYGNSLRVFENGGSFRGISIDLTGGGGSAGSAVYHSGNLPSTAITWTAKPIFSADVRVSGASPSYDWRETDETAPAGLWRAIASGGGLLFQRNTSAGLDYGTVDTPLTLKSGGGIDIAGDLAVARSAATALLTLSADAGQYRLLRFSTAGVIRWDVYAGADAETGSNAGSNWFISRFSDAGSYLGTPLIINRATGVATFEATPTVAGYGVWHANNDGSGSGLDADLLDGIQASQFLRSDISTAWNPTASGSYAFRVHNLAGANAASGSLTSEGAFEIFQSTPSADAYVTFHVSSDFAGHFGIDGTTNDLFVGGWSYGAYKHRVWHSGNSPKDPGPVANTLASRDGSGQLGVHALYLNRTGAVYVYDDLSALFPPYDGGNIWYMQSDNAASTGMALRTSDGNARGFVYGDTTGSAGQLGFLNASGAWLLRCDIGTGVPYVSGGYDPITARRLFETTAQYYTTLWNAGNDLNNFVQDGKYLSNNTAANTPFVDNSHLWVYSTGNYIVQEYTTTAKTNGGHSGRRWFRKSQDTSGLDWGRWVEYATGNTDEWFKSEDGASRTYYVYNGASIHGSLGGHEWRNAGDAWTLYLDNAADGIMSLRGTAPRFMLRDTAGVGSGLLSYGGYLFIVRQDGADSSNFDTGPGGNHPLVINLSNGNATLAGTLTELSDRRAKHDVAPFAGALDLLRRMPAAVSYRRSSIDKREVGWIAQDMLPVAPWLVETMSPTGMLSLAYGRATPIIAAALTELADMVDELRAELAALKRGKHDGN